ncbi:MAG: oligosaccharide flippase family protein [Candidatus Hydrogenedentes bacterium]|nr:oligosaccharide flippase family protein [Candidatus Hydrogenedentota bacterium]
MLGRGYWGWFSAIISVLGARVLASGAAFLGNVLVARQLEPSGYGQFYLLFTIMTLVAGLTGPAVDTSLVRFAARHIRPERDTSLPYFKLALYIKLVVFAITMLLGVALCVPLFNVLFTPGHGIQPWTVVLAFLGGAAVSLWGFAQSYFQSHQDFRRYAGFEFFSSSLRLVLVAALLALGSENVILYLAAYVTAPLLMTGISWLQLPRSVYKSSTSGEIGRELFAFAKWVILATFFTTLVQRLDLLLLGYFDVPKDEVGRYSAAVSLVLLGELVLLTFYNVLLPKASALREAGELRLFIGSFRIPSLLFSLGMGLLLPFASLLRQIFFGESYTGMEIYFVALLTGVIVSLSCAPAVTALYAVGRSNIIAGFEAVRLVVSLCLGLYLAPRYGAIGIAWAMALTRSGISVVTYFVAHQKVKRIMIQEYSQEAHD